MASNSGNMRKSTHKDQCSCCINSSVSLKGKSTFDPNKDAARIETAIKNKDTKTIIDILTKRSYDDRQTIWTQYKENVKKDMILALKGVLSGSLETVILGLMKSTAEYDASEINASIKLGTGGFFSFFRSPEIDKESLIEILCSRSSDEITEIKNVYSKLFKKELKEDMAGDFAKLLLALVEAKIDQLSSVTDDKKIDEVAKALYDGGFKGTHVKSLISNMPKGRVPHLQKVFVRFKNYIPYDMQESNCKEVNGDLEKSFQTLGLCIKNKPLYFAKRLHNAMENNEEKEKVLTRIMVSRYEVDLKTIKEEYEKLSKKCLCESMEEHTDGDYQRALLNLCN